MKDKDLIELMVQETFNTTENNVVSINRNKGHHLNFFHDYKRKCLIIHNDKKFLEIPENFNFFKNQSNTSIFINTFNDSESLLPILKKFFSIQENSIEIFSSTDMTHNSKAA